MGSLDFDWQTNEFMLYCRSTQLREKSIASYEQALRLFERWCTEELRIFTVDMMSNNMKVSELNETEMNDVAGGLPYGSGYFDGNFQEAQKQRISPAPMPTAAVLPSTAKKDFPKVGKISK